MASSSEFVAYLCDLLSPLGNVSARKMFGDYGIYVDGIFCALCCDDILYLKPLEKILEQYQRTLAPPYHGAKGWIVFDDPESDDALLPLFQAVLAELKKASSEKPSRRSGRVK
ncbi:TfoX/Sxy family protein [Parasphaerochaeta coccoides]|uniref:TfoX domain-containing protein n=1 Tax=Parasphaerochaeta coccoides (strain ATCC BAA-1237 / DSM 17374 / SPN1) TaxID=760011 RepID=F4GK11_PARC1|nr:TfoX/Sxy family protein [Parasphaerochaeta coccoides]AEC01783.1 TfoX domain-containing protein [Parasphaerochaeta coccoides DSM 17374]